VDVQIPSKAVSDGSDVSAPATALLTALNLLGGPGDDAAADGVPSMFTGPPQSVALIEAGATAASKWWATGFGASVIATWGSVAKWWPTQGTTVQVVVLGSAALVTAALVVSIGYLIASDVRGRAAAAVSVVGARAQIATEMIQAARAVYQPPANSSEVEIVPLPSQVRAKNLGRPAADEAGWLVVAMERHADGTNKYILVKGSVEATVPASGLEFD
jgi:hypothetical protein